MSAKLLLDHDRFVAGHAQHCDDMFINSRTSAPLSFAVLNVRTHGLVAIR